MTRYTQDKPVYKSALHNLCRRRRLIIMMALLSGLASMVWVFACMGHYKATATIMISPLTSFTSAEDIIGLSNHDPVNTAVSYIITSPEILEAVIVNQDLYRLNEFGGVPAATDYYILSADHKRRINDHVRQRVLINTEKNGIIAVSFRSNDAAKAADIANEFIDAYADFLKTRQQEEIQTALHFMEGRIDNLARDVRETQKDFKLLDADHEDTRQITDRKPAVQKNEIETITRRLSSAQASLVETQVILDEINKILYREQGPLVVPTFIDVPLFINLKEEQTNLQRRETALATDANLQDTAMAELRSDKDAFQQKLEEQIIVYANSLQVKKDIEQAEVKNLEERLVDLQNTYRAGQMSPDDIVDSEIRLDLAKNMLGRQVANYQEILQRLTARQMPLTVLSRAVQPQTPDWKGGLYFITLSVLIGAIVGGLWAIINGFFTSHVACTIREIEESTGLKITTVLPFVMFKKGDTVVNYLGQHPASALAETVRGFVATLKIRHPLSDRQGRVVTVTSTHADEGKTTFSVWLGTTAAQSGQKTLIIDADMRRPSLHKAYDTGNARGLADYLSGRLPLDDTIYKKHGSGVHLMTSKAIPVHALMLLGSERMEAMIRRLRDHYDLIIIDAPTSYLFTDAQITAGLSDSVLYVVEWCKTPLNDMNDTLASFSKFSKPEIILNKYKGAKKGRYTKKEMAYLGYFEQKI